MYALYETATGILKSTGTVLGNNLPDTLTVVELNQVDSDKLTSGQGIWDSETLSVIDNPNYVSPVVELAIPAPVLEQLKSDLEQVDPVTPNEIKIKDALTNFANSIG